MKTQTNKKLKFIGKRFLQVFFVDAKNSAERIISLFSALFWTWLEVSFLYFFFTFAFGISGYILGNNNYKYSYDTLMLNSGIIKNLIPVIVIFIFALRVPLYIKKEIKK